MKSLLYILILLLTACSLSAQQTIKGIVTDAENGQPVDAATVQIRKAGRQVPLTYTLTKADGTFILPLRQADDSLFVHVSLLGYKAIRQKITAGATLRIRLEPEVFTLKEVEIRPGHDQLRRVAIHQPERRGDQRRAEETARRGCGRRRENLVQREKHQQILRGRNGPDRRAVQPTDQQPAGQRRQERAGNGKPPAHPCPAKEADNRRYRHQPQTERRLPRPLDGHVRRRHGRFPPFVERHGQCHPDQP